MGFVQYFWQIFEHDSADFLCHKRPHITSWLLSPDSSAAEYSPVESNILLQWKHVWSAPNLLQSLRSPGSDSGYGILKSSNWIFLIDLNLEGSRLATTNGQQCQSNLLAGFVLMLRSTIIHHKSRSDEQLQGQQNSQDSTTNE